MAFNINDFRGELEFGGARSSLFEVTMTNPLNAAGDSKFRFLCRAAQVPAATVGVVTTPYFGRQVKHAGNRTFDPWTVTIINDVEFSSRTALEGWQIEIQSLDSGEGSTTTDYLLSRAYVEQLNKDDSVLAR